MYFSLIRTYIVRNEVGLVPFPEYFVLIPGDVTFRPGRDEVVPRCTCSDQIFFSTKEVTMYRM